MAKTKTDLCKCGEPKECHGSYGCLSSGCECKEYRPCLRFTDYTPKVKESAGGRSNTKRKPSKADAPAPFQPFEEYLYNSRGLGLTGTIIEKHKELCHPTKEQVFNEMYWHHGHGNIDKKGHDGECLICAMIDCPHGEPTHYHHDGCACCSFEKPEIDEKRLAEWLYEWDRERLNRDNTMPEKLKLPAWAQSGWRNKQIYRNKAKEAIEYAKRK